MTVRAPTLRVLLALGLGPACDPAAPLVAIEPASPTTTDDLVLRVETETPRDRHQVRWRVDGHAQSDLDGVWKVPAVQTTKGETWTAVVVAVGAVGQTSEPAEASVAIANTPPVVTAIALTPGEPREGDALVAVVSAIDADADAVTPSFAWYADAELRGTSATLTGADFDAGDVIHVVVTPFDGTDAGLPLASEPVTVVGTAPAITGVAIDPATGGETTTFTCAPQGWFDPDPADVEGYAFAWTVDDVVVATTATLDGSSFDKGDVIACTATPDDGALLGVPHASAGVTVANTPPAITGVTITPDPPREADTLTVAVSGWSDPDSADVEGYLYAWYAGAELRGTSATLTGAAFDAGDVIHVVVTPFDGTDAGLPLASEPVTVVGTAPAITGVAIDPATGGETTTFTCAPQGWFDPDPADVEGYAFAWTVDDLAVATTATLDGASFDKGDVIACTATPDDGALLGVPHTSAGVTVANTPPAITSVTITPNPAREADTVEALVAGWSDPDPADAPGYTYAWYVGRFWPPTELRSTSPTLTGADFDKFEWLQVVVTPWDGTEAGAAVSGAAVPVKNTPPTATTVVVSPATLYTDTPATATVSGWYDPDPADHEGYWYDWSVDGWTVGHAQTLDDSAFARGDEVTLFVTPDDGSEFGPALYGGTCIVQNRPPTAPIVRIAPAEPLDGEALVCDLEAPSWDVDDDDLLYDLTWLRDGDPTPWYATAASEDEAVEVPAGETALGEVWTCEATADDGAEPGPTASAAVRVSCGPNQIPAGMVGIDGCQTLSASFPTIGFAITSEGSPAEWTTSGVASARLPFGWDMFATLSGGLPDNATGSTVHFAVEPFGSVDELQVWVQDDWSGCVVGIRTGTPSYFTDFDTTTWFDVPAGMHTYDVTILPDQGGVALLVDGVPRGVLPGGLKTGDGQPFVRLAVLTRSPVGGGVALDHFSYTPGP